MKFAAALAGLFLGLSSLVAAHPLDTHNLQKKMESLQERYTQIVVTSGVPGKTYPRLEIRQMITQKPNQFTLLLLAMQQWQAQSESSATSYYGVSTIHGVPLVNYNNVGQCSNCGGAYGYCTHNMVLFPAWHRAYMALFEQEFMQVVNQVANQFTGSRAATMKAAAATMRFPYWDWAAKPPAGLPVIPKDVTANTINVNGPNGWKTINNPLFRSGFDNPSNMVYQDFVNYKVTYRYPTNGDSSASSQENKVIAAFAQQNANLRASVYQLMTACTDYLHFSNTGTPGAGSCTTSLEGIHNTVHQLSGGGQTSNTLGGHMYYLPTASYDPVFWLHHSNVDRLFAMWQTIHGNSYGASQNVPGMTWTVPQNSYQDANSALTPFYKDNSGNFWTTNEVRDFANTFHYTYPEFVDSDGSPAAIASYVNKLYGPSATATAGSSKRTEGSDASNVIAAAAAQITGAAASTASSLAGDVTGAIGSVASTAASDLGNALTNANGSTYQYYANVKAPGNAMNSSYIVYIFHNEPACEDPESWPMDTNLVGSVPILIMPGMPMNDGLRSAGSVPLTDTLSSLVTQGVLGGLAEPLVIPYLQSTLNWRVLGAAGESANPASIYGLLVSVSSATMSPVSSLNELPVISDFKLLPEVTMSKPGGLKSVESWAETTVSGVLSSLVNSGHSSSCALRH